jgi:hypothetical protein
MVSLAKKKEPAGHDPSGEHNHCASFNNASSTTSNFQAGTLLGMGIPSAYYRLMSVW